MQHQIVNPGPLLDDHGRLTETGFAVSLLKTYDKTKVAANRLRIKEWDYYCICTDHFAFALTIADNGYMTMDSISLLNFDDNDQITTSRMSIPAISKRTLPSSSAKGDVRAAGKDYEISFKNDGTVRHLSGHMERFYKGTPVSFDLKLTDAPAESMVIVTPFRDKPKAFYYNQKINCMRTEGSIRYGDREFICDPAHHFAVLDWGRGVWTYDNTWYWGSASGLADNVPFGFNIGYGFGDTSAASENVLFHDGKIHKLSQIKFEIPMKNGKEDYMSPWKFTSDNGRLEMDFRPMMDRNARINLGILCSDQHQVFGKFSGTAVLDSGQKIRIDNLMGFAEKVRNKW